MNGRYVRSFFAGVGVLGFVACSSGSSAPVGTPLAAKVGLDQEFEIAPGQTILISGPELSIRFDSVSADSRCPTDPGIQCVWEGDGAVSLTLIRHKAILRRLVLHTALQPKSAAEGTVSIALLALNPASRLEPRIKPDEYRAKLIVRTVQ